jgi:membrane-bound lytic murein transglycosylase MltF
VTLMASGTLGELVYKLGDVRPDDFARLSERCSTVHASKSTITSKSNHP